MAHTYYPWRIVATGLGVSATALGCYGAYEYALKLEGGQVTYLVLAAPMVAASAGLIPPLAESLWKQRQRIKSALWWGVLVPAAATVFFAAAERVHHAQASNKAEIGAYSSSVQRAKADLDKAKADRDKAQAEADKAKGWKTCGPQCKGLVAASESRQEAVRQAEATLLAAEARAVSESPLQAPVWLLPAALDVLAFMAIWTGLSGPWRVKGSPPAEPIAQPAIKLKVRPKKKPVEPVIRKRLRVVPRAAVND
jgi:hypothetical protein